MTDEAKITQQGTQIQATDTPARHGGSLAGEGVPMVSPGGYRFGVPRENAAGEMQIERIEGHGQDPAADGAQTFTGTASTSAQSGIAGDAAIAPAPAQPHDKASCAECAELRRRLDAIERKLGDDYGI